MAVCKTTGTSYILLYQSVCRIVFSNSVVSFRIWLCGFLFAVSLNFNLHINLIYYFVYLSVNGRIRCLNMFWPKNHLKCASWMI